MPSRRSKPLSPTVIARLLETASRVRERAYAPYSRFKVGAAVLTRGGAIHAGCNVENASYGLTLCAERAAVVAAVAADDADIVAAAIVTGADLPAPPCGACLQTLIEFADPGAPVILATARGKRARYQLRDLMPHGFDRKYL